MEDREFQDIVGSKVLRKSLLLIVSAVAFTVVAIAVTPGIAFAGTGTGGGSGGCTDSGQTVTCGAGVGGQPGSGGGDGAGATLTSAGGGSTAPQCPDFVPYSVAIPGGGDGGAPPAGAPQPGAWYVNLCAQGSVQGMATGVEWFATGLVPGTPPPDPALVGAQAASELRLASPSLVLSPSNSGYVNLAEWLWIDPSIWHPLTTTAQACNAGGCTTASATAKPAYVTWSTGDGSTVTCNGPGTVYDTATPADAQSTDCSHTYTESSAGQPSPDGNPNDAAFPITATVTWSVAWAGPDGSAGALPALTTEGTSTLKVAQIESVNN